MSFRRPVEKGYLVNWEAQKEVWDHTFLSDSADGPELRCDPHDTRLILAEAPNAPLSLQNNADQIVFEEYEFMELFRCVGAPLVVGWLGVGVGGWAWGGRRGGESGDGRTDGRTD